MSAAEQLRRFIIACQREGLARDDLRAAVAPLYQSDESPLIPGPYVMKELPINDGQPLLCCNCRGEAIHRRIQIRPDGPSDRVPFAATIEWCVQCGWPTLFVTFLPCYGEPQPFATLSNPTHGGPSRITSAWSGTASSEAAQGEGAGDEASCRSTLR